MMDSWVKKRNEAIERAQMRRDEEYHEPFETERLKLPPVPSVPKKGMVTKYLQGWPATRPSPFYKLRVHSVLRSAAETVGDKTILPMIIQRDSSRAGAPTRLSSYGYDDEPFPPRLKADLRHEIEVDLS